MRTTRVLTTLTLLALFGATGVHAQPSPPDSTPARDLDRVLADWASPNSTTRRKAAREITSRFPLRDPIPAEVQKGAAHVLDAYCAEGWKPPRELPIEDQMYSEVPLLDAMKYSDLSDEEVVKDLVFITKSGGASEVLKRGAVAALRRGVRRSELKALSAAMKASPNASASRRMELLIDSGDIPVGEQKEFFELLKQVREDFVLSRLPSLRSNLKETSDSVQLAISVTRTYPDYLHRLFSKVSEFDPKYVEPYYADLLALGRSPEFLLELRLDALELVPAAMLKQEKELILSLYSSATTDDEQERALELLQHSLPDVTADERSRIESSFKAETVKALWEDIKSRQ